MRSLLKLLIYVCTGSQPQCIHMLGYQQVTTTYYYRGTVYTQKPVQTYHRQGALRSLSGNTTLFVLLQRAFVAVHLFFFVSCTCLKGHHARAAAPESATASFLCLPIWPWRVCHGQQWRDETHASTIPGFYQCYCGCRFYLYSESVYNSTMHTRQNTLWRHHLLNSSICLLLGCVVQCMRTVSRLSRP